MIIEIQTRNDTNGRPYKLEIIHYQLIQLNRCAMPTYLPFWFKLEQKRIYFGSFEPDRMSKRQFAYWKLRSFVYCPNRKESSVAVVNVIPSLILVFLDPNIPIPSERLEYDGIS